MSVVDTQSGRVVYQLPYSAASRFSRVVFSHDSSRLYGVSARHITVLSTDDWREVARLTLSDADSEDAVFTGCVPLPNTDQLIVTRSDGELHRWIPGQPYPAQRFTGHLRFVNEVTVDPTGRQLFSQGFDRTVRIWDLSRGTGVLTLALGTLQQRSDRYGLALTPAGDRLAIVTEPERIQVLSTSNEEQVLQDLRLRAEPQP